MLYEVITQPGAYNVNALTTVTQALQIAGGIDTVGSLRKVQVKRGGQTVQQVDLYKLLIWGNSEDDIRLRPGDTVFIPAKGVEVSIAGLVITSYSIHYTKLYDLPETAWHLRPPANRPQ